MEKTEKSRHEKELDPLNLEELKKAGIEKVRLCRHFDRRFYPLKRRSPSPSLCLPIQIVSSAASVVCFAARALATASIAIFDYCHPRKHRALAAHFTRHALAAHITSEIR